MADAYYIAKRDLQATPKLRQKGAPVTLRSKTGGTFDPGAGTTTGGTEVNAPTVALMKSYSRGDIDGTLIMKDDRLCLMAAVDDNGVVLNPTPEMQLIAQGVTYRIMKVDPLAPGGVPIFFRLQLRI